MFLRLIVIAIYLVGFGWVADLNYNLRPLNDAERFSNAIIEQFVRETGVSQKEAEKMLTGRGGIGQGESFELVANGFYINSNKVELLIGDRVLSAEFGSDPLFGIKFLQSLIFFFFGLYGAMTIKLKDDSVDKEKKAEGQ